MTSTITKFSHLKIPLEDVLQATNNFDTKNVIGQGDLGKVYKGKLLRSGEWVKIAARRLDSKHKQGIEFLTEISALSSLEHENIVSFIGFCDEKGEKVIINKHAAKGSLSMYLNKPTLTWIQRLNICVGVARALSYIHKEDGRSYSIIHCNINSSTILLDHNFEPMLSGFEYSITQSVHRMDQLLFGKAIGTIGYIDPAIEKTGGVTHKSDVYSFGIVLWEILCERKAFIPNADDRFLAPLVRIHCENDTLKEIIQPGLWYQMGFKSGNSFSNAACSCLKDEQLERPDMNDIVRQLEKALELQLKYENFRKNMEDLKLRHSRLRIRLVDITLATDDFSNKYRIDDNELFQLYSAKLKHLNPFCVEGMNKGELRKRRTSVVIKRYLPREDKEDEETFFNEFEKLTTCKHHNIVNLLGFCDEGFEMILIVESFSKGYLCEYFNKNRDRRILTWVKRLKICLDVAHGLNYQHYEMDDQKMIINGSISCANIGLDKNWVAKITSCEFSKLLHQDNDDDNDDKDGDYDDDDDDDYDDDDNDEDDDDYHDDDDDDDDDDGVYGDEDYMDPEYKRSFKLKRKSDVYSFGVILFEVLLGRTVTEPIYNNKREKEEFAFVVRRCLREGTLEDMIDPVIKDRSGDRKFDLTNKANKDSLDLFVNIAYRCFAVTQDRRPTMKVVIQELEKALSYQEEQVHQEINKVVDEFMKSLELNRRHTEEQLLRHDIDKVVDEFKKSLQLNSRPLKEQVQHSNTDQVVDEFERSMQLNLTHENHMLTERSRNAVKSTPRTPCKGNNLEHLKIRLSDVVLATDNFSEEYRIMQTDYYDLYEAELEYFDKEKFASVEEKNTCELPKRCATVVIKRILPRKDKKGEKVFFTEIEMLTTCDHPNIVTLLGFCDEDCEMILVVEHVSNGYLYDYLIDIKDKPILTWTQRLKICLDVAHALSYLHYEMEDRKAIINRTITSTNIALDENLGAKILDLSFSLFLPPTLNDNALHLDEVIGSKYSIDPEYNITFKLKRESDVYSFGVVVFEILCGRVADDQIFVKESHKGTPYVARRYFNEVTLKEMIDPMIMKESGEKSFTLNRGPNKMSLDAFLKIACECLKETQDDRPTMKVVVKELEKALFLQENNKDLLRISLGDIQLATEYFHDKNCVGEGGFGKVYKGKLPQSDDTIAAKLLGKRSGHGEQQFRNELQILFEYKHENIIPLVGYCDEKDAKIIVYEYASRGSLDGYLRDVGLTWMRRLKICIDVATALDFLHTGVGTQATVIHRDIKTANILLNNDWNAKLADFGLSLLSAISLKTDYLIDRACGTLGYVDPLYLESGFLTKESDIYSFGVVLFEILCGRSTYVTRQQEGVYLPSFIKQSFEKGKQDEVVFEKIKAQIMPKALTSFQTIAYKCLHENRDARPQAKEVVKQLKKTLKLQTYEVGQKKWRRSYPEKVARNGSNFVFHAGSYLTTQSVPLIENDKHAPRISLEDIQLVTENFHDRYFVGEGRFWKVYKGKLPQGDDTIAVKLLDTKGGQGEQQFRNELQILFEYTHENIIRFVGYCDEEHAKIGVYEYASRGSLDKYLNDARLSWVKRLNICIEVATALDFLHRGVGTQATVMHRDIKTANILLTDDWNAKLADFGLSLRSTINKKTNCVIDRACGTQGYVDPLYLKSGFLTKESDIYSFGVVLFEILCGRSTFEIHKQEAVYLPNFIRQSFGKGKHDEVVFKEMKEHIMPKALATFQAIAYKCLHENKEERPEAKEVVEQLKKTLKLQMYKVGQRGWHRKFPEKTEKKFPGDGSNLAFHVGSKLQTNLAFNIGSNLPTQHEPSTTSRLKR